MKRLVSAAIAATVGLVPTVALACGAFFASEIEVSPDQKIAVVHRAGVETYVFRPHFCGAAKDFGVILPIPSTLATNPTLADNALFDQLDDLTQPQVIEVCEQTGPAFGCAAAKAGNAQLSAQDAGTGVNVIDRGRVGQFDYALVQATTVNAFTDWLDANGFPHGTNTDIWQHYVTNQWYFVAFKVSADTSAPPAGQKLCGDLGPIQLSFASTRPVVPTRVAAVNGQARWRVFVIASGQHTANTFGGYVTSQYFSGSLTQPELALRPALGALAKDGEWLSAVDVFFSNPTSDLQLSQQPTSSPFRTTRTVSKPCNGCASGGSAIDALGAAAMLGLLARLRRGRRSAG